MESRPGFLDEEELVHWITEQADRSGKPIPEELVRRVLELELEFEVLVGNAIRLDRPSEDLSILCIGDNVDIIQKNPICRLCVLALGTVPPQGDGSAQRPQ